MRVIGLAAAARGRLAATIGGALAVALPGVAAAQKGLRELETPADTTPAVALVVLAVAALFAVSSIAFLYRRQRRLHWDYQLPDGWLSEGAGLDPDGVDPDAEHADRHADANGGH